MEPSKFHTFNQSKGLIACLFRAETNGYHPRSMIPKIIKNIFLFDVISGSSLAVLTPDKKVTACEVTTDGRTIVLAMEGSKNLTTCLLCHNTGINDKPEVQAYGNPENIGKIYDLATASR